MFRRNWVKTTGLVIDARVREVFSRNRVDPEKDILLHSYIVEFQTPNGDTITLPVDQHLSTIDLSVGSKVPLLVSPDMSKAVLDSKDPAINYNAVFDAAQEESFRRQAEG